MAEISSSALGAPKGKVRVKKMSTKLDMTPMVDLAFLLLTFFVLTTSLLEPMVMPIRMPEKETDGGAPIPAHRVLTLVLDDENAIYWYIGLNDPEVKRTDYSSKGITDLIIRKKSEVNKMVVLVKPSEKASYRNLVDIIDELSILELDYYIVKITATDTELVDEAKADALSMQSSP